MFNICKRVRKYYLRQRAQYKLGLLPKSITYHYSNHQAVISTLLSEIDPKVFEKHWRITIADSYELLTLGKTLDEFNATLRSVTIPLNSPLAFTRKVTNIQTTSSTLGQYLNCKEQPYAIISEWVVLVKTLNESLQLRKTNFPQEWSHVEAIYSYYTKAIAELLIDLFNLQLELVQ